MTIEINDPETIALIRLLAARTGDTDEGAVDAAVTTALGALGGRGTSYRERRNARVRARALEAEQPPSPQSV
ncbi:type II toxin-antitoxin system VapB family antitoxin [Demequina aurantiaca]|uniref:type II toxin-antitoxin system VapB family antitoxin n=1 Tax=Demequina aurantiaca TaxID=676200 RepID=UPI003D34FA9E